MELLPLFEDKRLTCSSCIAACCLKDTVIPLKLDEAERLAARGTELHRLPKAERQGNKPGRGRDFYVLDADCANLTYDPATDQKICGDYENRPGACREFKEGGFGCAVMRAQRMPMELEATPAGPGPS